MRRGWLYTREEIMWFVKDNKKFIWNKKNQYSSELVVKFSFIPKGTCKRLTNVWTDINEEMFKGGKLKLNNNIHFAQKPIKAIERIIKAHTKEGDIVLDCFMGSGTTAVACINTKRDFIGIELSEEYCKIANERLTKLNSEGKFFSNIIQRTCIPIVMYYNA